MLPPNEELPPKAEPLPLPLPLPKEAPPPMEVLPNPPLLPNELAFWANAGAAASRRPTQARPRAVCRRSRRMIAPHFVRAGPAEETPKPL